MQLHKCNQTRINQLHINKDCMPLSKLKLFKILIDKAVAIDFDGRDYSAVLIEIKDKNEKIIKSCPLNLILKFTTTLQTFSNIYLHCSLLEFSNLGARQSRIFAEGYVHVECSDVEKEHTFAVACQIKNIINKKTVLSLVVVIKQDLERINCSIIDSQPSQISQIQIQNSPRQTHQQPLLLFLNDHSQIQGSIDNEKHNIKSVELQKQQAQQNVEPQKSNRQIEQVRKKPSPIKRLARKPIRARHFEYNLKNESSNFELTNKVTEQQTNCIQNLRLDLDQAISSIQIYGKEYKQLLAQVLFKTNPSQQQLKQLKIKIPQSQKIIDIYLKTMEGKSLHADATLPQLDQKECLKIQCNFKDQNQQVKAKIKFNFKQTQILNQQNGNRIQQRMPMTKNVMTIQKSKLKEQVNFLPFLFPQPKYKPQQSPRIKFPKIFQKQAKLIINQTINEQIKPIQQPQLQKKAPLPIKQNKNSIQSKQETSEFQQIMERPLRTKRSKTIQNHNYANFSLNASNYESKSMIKIFGVSVKFYKTYLQRFDVKNINQSFVGKSLFIYANTTNIYRSQAAYASKILNWNLRKCEIQMNSYENLTFELTLQKEKTLIGDLIVSYNQLKYNQEQNSLYFGYLTKNHDVIAKICIDFKLSDNMQHNSNHRMSTLDHTQRRPRLKRLYSQDINSNQEIFKKQSPNKASLYHSLATITSIPQIKKKTRRSTQNFKQHRILSPIKRNY